MKEILTTERLSLAEWEMSDAPFLLKLVNTEEWIANIGDRNVRNLADSEAYIKKLRLPYGSYGYGFYAVRLRSTGELIGLCGITKRMGLDDPDIGFALMPEYVGQGYMQEASKAMLSYAFVKLGISRIVAITTDHNTRSKKLLEKIGLKYEKEVKLPKDPEILKQYAYERRP